MRWVLSWLALSACGGEKAPECSADTGCGSGQICHQTACVAPARLDCPPGDAPDARIGLDAVILEFGAVSTEPVTRTVLVSSLGGCTLKLDRAVIVGGANSRFVCETCTDSVAIVYPGRTLPLTVRVEPGAPGSLQDKLRLESNDPTQRVLEVSLRAESAGLGAISVSPTRLDFGFVAGGQTAERSFTVINPAQGTTEIEVSAITMPNGAPFVVTPARTLPARILPARTRPGEQLDVTVRYQPSTPADQDVRLKVEATSGESLEVQLLASQQPPVLRANPARIDFGTLRLGRRANASVTVQNAGRSPLLAQASLSAGTNADLVLARGLPSSLGPGQVFELVLIYQPTLAAMNNQTLVITSNDPLQPRLELPVTATGEADASQVLAVEVRYENDSDSSFDRDLRDLDLILESPDGRLCSRAQPNGNWGPHGMPSWTASPPKRNPQRIVLPGASQDGRFIVSLSYLEDCATLPTALTAALLGLGVEELSDALSEDMFPLPREDVAAAIEQACVDRRATNATLIFTANGAPIGMRSARLGVKGELQQPAVVVLKAGRFSLE